MSLIKGTNSYVEVNEADVYFTTRLDSEAWGDITNSEKASALVTASSILDEFSWTGVAENSAQEMAFPRRGQYFDPRLGGNVALEGIPKRIINATCELALHLLMNGGVLSESGSVESLKISGIELQNIKSSSRMPSAIKRMVRPLLVNSGSSLWWRAN